MGNFFTDVIQRDSRYRSPEVVNDIALLEPGFRAKVAAVIDAAKTRSVDLVATETYRSVERQQRLYAAGKTQLRTVGVHHYGLAVDFAKRVNGKPSWDGDWTFLCELAAANGAVAGGDWGEPNKPHSFRDWDHLQGCTIAQQTALFAGTWYPAATGTGTLAPVPVASIVPRVKTVPSGLTPEQAKVLSIVDDLNDRYWSGWFNRSSVMAFVEVESGFNERAVRREPSGVTSYGLMQVLDSTAAGLGLTGSPEQLYVPLQGLFYGMKYAAQGWNYLLTHLGRPPTLIEWCEGYNEGYGAAARGRPDLEYSGRWLPPRDRWAALVDG